MNMLKRIRLYLLIALCTAPMMFGSEPSDTCSEDRITSHVRTASGAAASGIVVSLEYFTGDDALDTEELVSDRYGCRPAPLPLRARDTTDSEGSFSFLVKTRYDRGKDVDVTDTFRILVTLPNDSVITGLLFSEADTTSTRPIYYESLYGSGCGECSSSPDTYHAGFIFIYNDRVITLP